jgi:hypothetical protein
MKTVTATIACVLLASASYPSLAADTQTVFEGFATVTAATIQCSGFGGTGVGDTHVSIYRPHILTTDTETYFALYLLRAAETFGNTNESTVPQMRGAGNYMATQISGRALPFNFSSTYNFTSIIPATITAKTNYVKIVGSIDTFDNAPGCTINFEAVYTRRID